MKTVIEVNNVSKRFMLGSDSIKNALLNRKQNQEREFWALKDISFEIEPGQSVGIVGHNGSGKSTMLKLLTGILQPTSGSIRMTGRAGALIEVGAGFHPDLTGRENVFLNGSILGLSRREIASKFDEIVDFAGLEQFIDTPVKRYSSGMYMRLGFAIAAHIDPEILIIDEVLAVGDAQFQRKCLKRMKDFARSGGTVVFVSHAMSQMADLCRICVWLDHGQVHYIGDTQEAIGRYMALVSEREEAEFKRKHPEEWKIMEAESSDLGVSPRSNFAPPIHAIGTVAQREWTDRADAPGNDTARLRSVRVLDRNGSVVPTVDVGEPVAIEMVFDVLEAESVLVPNLHFFDAKGNCVFMLHDLDPAWRGVPRPTGRYTSLVRIPGNFLNEGTLRVAAVLSTHIPRVAVFADVQNAVAFTVVDDLKRSDTARGDYQGSMPGAVRPLLEWSTRREDLSPGSEPITAMTTAGGAELK